MVFIKPEKITSSLIKPIGPGYEPIFPYEHLDRVNVLTKGARHEDFD